MTANFFVLLPEFCLLMAFLLSVGARLFRQKATPKTFYTLTKFGLLAAVVSLGFFYDENFLFGCWENTVSSSLFKLLMYVMAFLTVFLSAKYFLSKDYPSFRFYSLLLISLLLFSGVLSSVDIRLSVFFLEFGFLLNFYFIRTEGNDEETLPVSINFLRYALFWTFLSFGAVFVLVQEVGSASLSDIALYYKNHTLSWPLYCCGSILLLATLYKWGVAPFHFWLPDVLGATILPVSCFFAIVPVVVYYAVFVKFSVLPFLVPFKVLLPAFYLFSLLSIGFGAVGANAEINLRRLMAYSRIFFLGIVLALFVNINTQSLYSSFIYLLVSMLALSGIYIAFYGLKRKGEYLRRLNELSGLAESKPFISAAMLIFMMSLLGFPPLLGFLGMTAVMHSLAAYRDFVLIALILFGIVIMAAAYLRVIKTFYFDIKRFGFDRADIGIYFSLVFALLVLLVLVLNPKYFMNDISFAMQGLLP